MITAITLWMLDKRALIAFQEISERSTDPFFFVVCTILSLFTDLGIIIWLFKQ